MWGRRPCDDGGRGWSANATKPGMLRISGNHQKLEEARKDSAPEPSKGAQPCQNFDLGLLAPRTVREYSSAVLSCPVCGTLSQQPRGTNTFAQHLLCITPSCLLSHSTLTVTLERVDAIPTSQRRCRFKATRGSSPAGPGVCLVSRHCPRCFVNVQTNNVGHSC